MAIIIVVPIVAYLMFVYMIRPRGFEQGRLRLYEMDMRIDEDISMNCAVATYLGDIPCTHCPKPAGIQGQPNLINLKVQKIECSTYRIDRRAIDEAIHKIHTELTLEMPTRSTTQPTNRGPWGWLRRYVHKRRARQLREIKLFLVYEILFHRPSGEPGYMLRELRVIAPYFQALDAQDVLELKEFVLEHLVHNKLPKETRVDQNFDSLLSLNVHIQ